MKNKMPEWVSLLIMPFFLIFPYCRAENPPGGNEDGKDTNSKPSLAETRNQLIGRGINFGNALEAPNEGDWGLVIKESYIQAVKDAGFSSVRLPVCWPAHTDSMAPYAIDPLFLVRVDQILNWCLDRKLAVIITIHHFNELYENPGDNSLKEKFYAIWDQLTLHYREVNPDKLFFEVLNEPHGNLTPSRWNLMIPAILQRIRARDTSRTIILDVPDYGYHSSVYKLQIPDSEKNVIISVRYYLPYEFTHQGAHWVENSNQWLGKTWTGTDIEKSTILADLTSVKQWSDDHHRPVTIGEFGVIINADQESRVRWTKFVRQQFENQGFSWSYFDFGVIFRSYDIETGTWLEGFRDAFFGK